MSRISISEAAELTGQSIPTLYRHIKDGKLSQIDNKVDTAELLRLYGSFRSSTDYRRENELLRRSNIDLNRDKEKLYQINELLRSSNVDLMRDKENLYRIIASQQKSMPIIKAQLESAKVMRPNKKVEDRSLIQRLIRKLFFN